MKLKIKSNRKKLNVWSLLISRTNKLVAEELLVNRVCERSMKLFVRFSIYFFFISKNAYMFGLLNISTKINYILLCTLAAFTFETINTK